jgi:hypothetical protein
MDYLLDSNDKIQPKELIDNNIIDSTTYRRILPYLQMEEREVEEI